MRKSKKQKMIDGLIEAQRLDTRSKVDAPLKTYIVELVGETVPLRVEAHGLLMSSNFGTYGFYDYQEVVSDAVYSELHGLIGGCEAVDSCHTMINPDQVVMIKKVN